MALATAQPSVVPAPSARSLQGRRWDRHTFHLLAMSGAATVIAGSYATWATFYAGLIARNGVSGHGKYFIGLAVAAALVSILASVRGVWGGLRWLVVPAGVAIAALALRDLRNLEALVGDPAAGFYLPGRGPGLFVVIAGAVVLGLAPIARPLRDAGGARVASDHRGSVVGGRRRGAGSGAVRRVLPACRERARARSCERAELGACADGGWCAVDGGRVARGTGRHTQVRAVILAQGGGGVRNGGDGLRRLITSAS